MPYVSQKPVLITPLPPLSSLLPIPLPPLPDFPAQFPEAIISNGLVGVGNGLGNVSGAGNGGGFQQGYSSGRMSAVLNHHMKGKGHILSLQPKHIQQQRLQQQQQEQQQRQQQQQQQYQLEQERYLLQNQINHNNSAYPDLIDPGMDNDPYPPVLIDGVPFPLPSSMNAETTGYEQEATALGNNSVPSSPGSEDSIEPDSPPLSVPLAIEPLSITNGTVTNVDVNPEPTANRDDSNPEIDPNGELHNTPLNAQLSHLTDPSEAQVLQWLTAAKPTQLRLWAQHGIPSTGPTRDKRFPSKAKIKEREELVANQQALAMSVGAAQILGAAHAQRLDVGTSSAPAVGTGIYEGLQFGVPGLHTDINQAGMNSNGTNGGGNQDEDIDELNESKEFELGKWKEPGVWYLEKTGEVFTTYEAYAERMSFYRQRVFQADVQSTQNQPYFEAVVSERTVQFHQHGSFPEALKYPLLSSIQFTNDLSLDYDLADVEGRSDDLLDKVYDRFASRFFEDEKIFVELEGDKFLANILRVIPPAAPPVKGKGKATPACVPPPHSIGCDLGISPEDAVSKDDPSEYRYGVRLITQADIDDNVDVRHVREGEDMYLEVEADQLSRDRTQFSKITLKRFLKESIDREPGLYTPWQVNADLCEKYKIPSEMTDEIRAEIEARREQKMEKRKKPKKKEEEDELVEERPPAKKQKTEAGESKVKGEGKGKVPKVKPEEPVKTEEEIAAQEAEDAKKRRRPTKFPAEDLLIEFNQRDKTENKPVTKPLPSRQLPFAGNFDQLLLSWSFLNALSKPLGLSPFTIDQLEGALYHGDAHNPSVLAVEIHVALLSVIRKDHIELNQPRVYPLKAFQAERDQEELEEREGSHDSFEDSQSNMELLNKTALDLMEEWESRDLSGSHKKDWCKSLVGCLWARGMRTTLPNLLTYVRHIALENDSRRAATGGPGWEAEGNLVKVARRPDYRYASLHPIFKLEIIGFLCELVMQTKVVRDTLEESSTNLTKARVDIVEMRRELKKVREDLLAMEPKPVANGEDAVPMEVDIDVNGSRSRSPSMANTGTERDELEDAHESDAGSASETASGAGGSKRGKSTSVSRQKLLLAKQVQRDAEAAVREAQSAKDREGAKAKRQEGKATAEEKRRLQEEQERLYGSLEELDREFRRQYYYPRMSPIGQDRFGNRFWWFDGVGSASLSDALGGVIYGTGRVYVQGGSTRELEARAEESEMDLDELREKRSIEETAEGFLNEGEWAVYETPEQFQQLVKWLHIRGREEKRLLETLTKWSRFIEGGMKRRIDVFDLEAPIVGEDGRRARRPVGAPKETFKGRNAYLNYKNTYSK